MPLRGISRPIEWRDMKLDARRKTPPPRNLLAEGVIYNRETGSPPGSPESQAEISKITIACIFR